MSLIGSVVLVALSLVFFFDAENTRRNALKLGASPTRAFIYGLIGGTLEVLIFVVIIGFIHLLFGR